MWSPNSRRFYHPRKDYSYGGDWFGLTPSNRLYASLGGYLGLAVGWVEGFEINFLVPCLALTFDGRH